MIASEAEVLIFGAGMAVKWFRLSSPTYSVTEAELTMG
jgi:hypothetical protein